MRRKRDPGQQPEAPPLVGGTITKITPQRDPARVNLFLDDHFALGLATELVEERGLRVGQVLSTAEVQALDDADDLNAAVNRAIAFLTVRPRSIREVRDRLKEKGVPPEVIDATLEKLAGWGYVGDDGFARYWIENRLANQPRGKRLLRQELWQKGVDRETADQALAAAEIDEEDAALALARKRLQQLHAYDEATQRRRLASYLQRRGYTWPTVKRALDQLLSPTGADDGEALGDSDSYGYDEDTRH